MDHNNFNEAQYSLDKQSKAVIDIESINLLGVEKYDGMIVDSDNEIFKRFCLNFDYEIVDNCSKANVEIRFFSSPIIFELLTHMCGLYNIKFTYNNGQGELNHTIQFNRCKLHKICSLQKYDHLLIVASFVCNVDKGLLFEHRYN